MNSSGLIANFGVLWLLIVAIWLVITIIILKIITIIITNTVLDVIEKRKGRNWWQR